MILSINESQSHHIYILNVDLIFFVQLLSILLPIVVKSQFYKYQYFDFSNLVIIYNILITQIIIVSFSIYNKFNTLMHRYLIRQC